MRHIALILILLATCVSQGLHADEPTLTRAETVTEDWAASDVWYGAYVAGSKAGWAHDRVHRAGSGRAALWVVRMEAHLRMEVMGQSMDMVFGGLEIFDGNPPYAFRRSASYEYDGENRHEVRVRAEADGVRAWITEGGETRERKGPLPDYTFTDYVASTAWIRTGPAVGEAIKVRSYDVEELESDITTYAVTALETEILGGVPVALYTVEMSTEGHGESGSTVVDTQGRPQSMKMGNLFEMRREPEEIAKRREVGSLDVFLFGAVKIDRPLGDPTKVTRLVLEVKGEGKEELIHAPGQEVLRQDGKILLKLGYPQTQAFVPTAEELVDATKETSEHPIHHAAVIALAKRAIGDAASDREKVTRLVAFVDEHLKDANLATSPSVVELLKCPEGDCTEHALLFTVLAKSVGIPAREVGGVMYMGDKHQAFGGHAWSEVVLDGRWVPVDPAWGQMKLDATHVTLSRTERDSMRMLEAYGRLTFVLRELEAKR